MLLMESPDVPWDREYEARSPKPFTHQPSPGAVFFLKFLKSKGVRTDGRRLADVGCGNGRDSVFFARNGFEVHAIDRDGSAIEDLDLHGVTAHCHSVTDCWLFEDSFFDFATDVLCYAHEQGAGCRKSYRDELNRALKSGGYYLLCVPASAGKSIAAEFSGFSVAASEESDDAGTRVLNVILFKP